MAVIGRHMELKRSGRTWKGCCVFHGERTPSFHVYPEDKHFKCYGCGEFGDVFKFLQKLQGKEFPEVVRELAAEVGVQIPEVGEDESAEAMRRRKDRAFRTRLRPEADPPASRRQDVTIRRNSSSEWVRSASSTGPMPSRRSNQREVWFNNQTSG